VVHDTPTSREISLIFASLLVGFLFVQLLLFMLRARHINVDVLSAVLSAYLLLGILFAFGHSLIARVVALYSRRPPARRH
jgi:hypothetical protein